MWGMVTGISQKEGENKLQCVLVVRVQSCVVDMGEREGQFSREERCGM